MQRRKYTETEVASAVMEHFAAEGWECYPEVELPGGSADIVAIRPMPFSNGKTVHIIECKTSWSSTLLEQAIDRREFAHYVTVAAPATKRYNKLFWMICRDYWLGMIELTGADRHVHEHRDYPARLMRGLKAEKRINFGPW